MNDKLSYDEAVVMLLSMSKEESLAFLIYAKDAGKLLACIHLAKFLTNINRITLEERDDILHCRN